MALKLAMKFAQFQCLLASPSRRFSPAQRQNGAKISDEIRTVGLAPKRAIYGTLCSVDFISFAERQNGAKISDESYTVTSVSACDASVPLFSLVLR